MAGLVRLHTVTGLKKGLSLITNKKNLCRTIGTSSKKNDTLVAENPTETQPVKKNWVSWGYDKTDEKIDRHVVNAVFFVSVTLCLVSGAYFKSFSPDVKMLDWAQREAYLELRRREELGLPPIDKDYYDPATMILPTDEELGDTPIII